MAITPGTKNWTRVLDRPCPECGFDAAATAFDDVPGLLRSSAEDWRNIPAPEPGGITLIGVTVGNGGTVQI